MNKLSCLLYQFYVIGMAFGIHETHEGNFRNVSQFTPWSPVVGVLTHPPDDSNEEPFVREFVVEFLESAGIQVVPLRYDDPNLESQLTFISGVYFSDGSIEVTLNHPYVKAASTIYEHALKRHSDGHPFPLIGMCEGHQILAALAAGTTHVIAKNAYTTTNVALSLTIKGDGGKMLGSFPPNVRDILENGQVTANIHENGVPSKMWDDFEGLRKQFVLTSTSIDPGNLKEFSATMESQPDMAPMHGLQWHPEMVPYVWDPHCKKALVKTMDSRRVSNAFNLFVADVFHDKLNKFPNEDELGNALIRNYHRVCYWSNILFGLCYYEVPSS